ncbi:MAG: 50S ribosomal protein L9 [Anaerolineales bacterium]|nr:50S ribosomal protein L9 [Chloroflexota bacterium]MBL6980932.1 50S ribosomal protein L9 [Anaerolineales bacterium]
MKVLLLKDVFKLGRAGDVKKVANGYGRNYLIPQGLAVLATPGALNQVDRIRTEADKQRNILNEELSGLADQMRGVTLTFPVRASETGRLYGSVNTRMIAEALSKEVEEDINHNQIDAQPLRMIGKHMVGIRLTVDLVPEISVIIFREGETPEAAIEEAEALAEAVEQGEFEIDDRPVYEYELEEEAEEAAMAVDAGAETQEEEADEDADTTVEADADVETE